MDEFDYEQYYSEKRAMRALFTETPDEYIARRGLAIPPTDEWPIPEEELLALKVPLAQRLATEDLVMNLPSSPPELPSSPVSSPQGGEIVAPPSNVPPTTVEARGLSRQPSLEIIEFTPPTKLKNPLPPAPETLTRRKPAVKEPQPDVHKNVVPLAMDMNDSIEEISAYELSKLPQTMPKPSSKRGAAKRKSPARPKPLPLKKVVHVLDDDGDGSMSPIEDASEFPPSPSANAAKPNKKNGPDVLSDEHKVQRLMAQLGAHPSRRNVTTTDAGNQSSVIYVSSAPSSREASPVPKKRKVATKQAVASSSKRVTAPKTSSSVKGKAPARPSAAKKKKEESMTPAEYAQYLMDEVAEAEAAGRPKKALQTLQGMNIFYFGFEHAIVSRNSRPQMRTIVEHGATLSPTFDPETVTMVVVSEFVRKTHPQYKENADCKSLRTALGIRTWSEFPKELPVVWWDWIKQTIEGNRRPYWERAAVTHTVDIGRLDRPIRKRRRTQEEVADSGDERDNRPKNRRRSSSGPRSPHPSTAFPAVASSSKPNIESATSTAPSPYQAAYDDLAPFEPKAAQIVSNFWPDGDESDVSDPEDDNDIHVRYSRGFACDRAGQVEQTCPNQDLIDILSQLKDIHDTKLTEDDRWRVLGYTKAIRSLRTYPKRITSEEEARKLPGIGEKTARKIMEIIETGNLARLHYELNSVDYPVKKMLKGIYGVGKTTALRWYNNGVRTLEDVKEGRFGVKLTAAQEIGVRFYEDINSRMPRSETKELYDLIRPIALKIDPQLFIEVMGSYRRGKADCGDIDILITRDPSDGRTHYGVLRKLISALHRKGILTEDLAVPEDYEDLEAIYRGLCRLPHIKGSRRRRIDFLTVPWSSKGAALLYYTGDDVFNRSIRLKAHKMGFSLNQRGLYKDPIRDPNNYGKKLHPGTLIAGATEEKIFEILKVPWVPPEGRIRNPSIPEEAVR